MAAQGVWADAPPVRLDGLRLRRVSFSSLLDSKNLFVVFLSLCKSDLWASFGCFLITPSRNKHLPKLMEIVS